MKLIIFDFWYMVRYVPGTYGSVLGSDLLHDTYKYMYCKKYLPIEYQILYIQYSAGIVHAPGKYQAHTQ